MSFIGRNPTADFLELKPQSADPTSPAEGHLQYADGTARSVGLWIYKGGNWTNIGNTTVPALSVSTKTANYTLTSSDDCILADASGGSFTLTLPSAAANSGKVFYVVRKDSGATTVNVGSGTPIAVLTNRSNANFQSECVSVVSDGTNWQILEASSTGYKVVQSGGLFTVSANNTWTDYSSMVLPQGTWALSGTITSKLTGGPSNNTTFGSIQVGISTTSGNSTSGLVLPQNYAAEFNPSVPTIFNAAVHIRTVGFSNYVITVNSGTSTYYCKYAFNWGGSDPTVQAAVVYVARKIGM